LNPPALIIGFNSRAIDVVGLESGNLEHRDQAVVAGQRFALTVEAVAY
jgi:hypothetical protein